MPAPSDAARPTLPLMAASQLLGIYTSPSYSNTDVWGTSGTLRWVLGALQLSGNA